MTFQPFWLFKTKERIKKIKLWRTFYFSPEIYHKFMKNRRIGAFIYLSVLLYVLNIVSNLPTKISLQRNVL